MKKNEIEKSRIAILLEAGWEPRWPENQLLTDDNHEGLLFAEYLDYMGEIFDKEMAEIESKYNISKIIVENKNVPTKIKRISNELFQKKLVEIKSYEK